MARQIYGRGRPRGGGTGGPALVYTLCLGLLLGWYGPGLINRPTLPTISATEQSRSSDTLSAQFGFCHSGGGIDCVVDGDTFWFGGAKYRIADIDTPETHGPRCASEGALGAQATQRLQVLPLHAGKRGSRCGPLWPVVAGRDARRQFDWRNAGGRGAGAGMGRGAPSLVLKEADVQRPPLSRSHQRQFKPPRSISRPSSAPAPPPIRMPAIFDWPRSIWPPSNPPSAAPTIRPVVPSERRQ